MERLTNQMMPTFSPFPEDLALARQITQGDTAALGSLYERYADALFAFIYHRLEAPRPEVEEIWQETWLAAIRSLPTYRGQSQLSTWLCSLAQHKIADYCRKRGRQAQVFASDSTEMGEAALESAPLPEEILARREVRSRVVQTLMALPEEYRLALSARYAEERSVEEVARLLGKPYKAAESLLGRAKKAFRSAFCEE